MSKTNQLSIGVKDYSLLGALKDESNALWVFENEYDSGYVCDVIMEIADNHIPIYNYDVWENVKDIQEYVEEAIEQGLVDMSKDVDLIKVFQAGYYEYYTRSLYNNLDVMVFNMIVSGINEFLNENSEEYIGNIDLDEVEQAIEEVSFNYDNNNKISDIIYEADKVIQAIKDGEYDFQ